MILGTNTIATHFTAERAKDFLCALRGRVARLSPFKLNRRRQLRASYGDVETVVADLQEVSAALEERFLETAKFLMELDAHGSQFVRNSEKLVNVATGRAGGSEVFFAAMQVLDPPLNFLNESHVQMKALLDRLKLDNDRIISLINGRDDLQRTMAPLKYIQTSFRVEAAPLGDEVQMMFSALTQEIEKLHTQVCEIFSTKYEELQGIQRTIAEVIQQLQIQTDNVWQNIAREKTQIDSTLAQLQRELVDNQKRESSIAGLSGNLAREIQGVVIGLQYQDIISQRLQHTNKALLAISEQFDGSADGIEFMEQACRVESQQIKSVRGELAGAEKSIKGGISNVLSQIVSADEKCVALREFDGLTTSANGMVQVLLDVFEVIQKQIGTTVSGCASAVKILRPIGSMASDLTRVVHDLSQRIHLIGLNAQVQAAQVPEGMGLEVLSARTSEISRETNRISEHMAAQLDQLVAGLNESLKALEKLHADASAQQAVLTEKGGDCEKRLHTLRDSALAALIDVHDLLNGIRAQSELVIGSANYISTADDALADLEQKLICVADLAAEQIGENRRRQHGLLARFKQHYTMASELRVHENALAGKLADEISAPVSSGEVELFDAPAAGAEMFTVAPATPASTAKAPAVADANVELF